MLIHYRARDPRGNPVKGQVEATSPSEAEDRLYYDGFTSVEVAYAEDDAPLFPRRVRKSQIIFLTSQLAIMAQTGITLSSALGAIANQESNPTLRSVLLDLKSSVASDTSKVEDTVRATLRQPVVIDGETVLPTGTELVGTVTEVERSGRVKGRARVAYRFSSLRHDSERYDITTATIAHEAEATKKKDATKIGIGAGAGALIGAIAGGGKGAAIGTAVGAGAGTGAVMATRGDEVRLPAGTVVTTKLRTPLTVLVPGD